MGIHTSNEAAMDAAVVRALVEALQIAERQLPGITDAAFVVARRAIQHGDMTSFESSLASPEYEAWIRIKNSVLQASLFHARRNYLLGLLAETLFHNELDPFMERNSSKVIPERV